MYCPSCFAILLLRLISDTPYTFMLKCWRCGAEIRLQIEIAVASAMTELELHKLKYPDNMSYTLGRGGERVYTKIVRPGEE